MATPSQEDFDASQLALMDQIQALAQKQGQLRAQTPHLLGGAFVAQHNNQIQAVQNQISALKYQYDKANEQQRMAATGQDRAQRTQIAAQKAQEARQKQAETARKKATDETKDKLSSLLGVKKGEVDDALKKSYYDPVTHKVVTPKEGRLADDAKAKATAAKAQLEKEIGKFAPNDPTSNKKVPISIGTLFGDNALPYTTNDDGARIYTTPDGEDFTTIPKAYVDRFEKLDAETRPKKEDVERQVNPELFTAAERDLNILSGVQQPGIVRRDQDIASRFRGAQPALDGRTTPTPFTGLLSTAMGLLPNQRIVPQIDSGLKPILGVPSGLPGGVATLAQPTIDPRQSIVMNGETAVYDPSTDITQQNITQRLPQKQVNIPQLGILPSVTRQLPAETAAVGFQTQLPNNEFAPPPMWQGTDGRLPFFRPPTGPTPASIRTDKSKKLAAQRGISEEAAAGVLNKVIDLNPKDSNEYNALVDAGVGALPEVKNRGIIESIRMNPTSGGIFRALNSVNPASTQENSLEKGLARLSAPVVDAMMPDMYNNPDMLESALKLQKAKGLIPDNTTLKQFVADRINSDQEMADAAAQEPMY